MLLSDTEIEQALRAIPPLVEHLNLARPLTDPKSPVQAASVDLTVGRIYLPDAPKEKLVPHETRSLPAGHTAVVETKEVVHLPSTIGAIGFPPSRVSAQGLLTTNPGHVDPGYEGRLSLTVVNMGRRPYPLEPGDPILTMLFFKLTAAPAADYQQRNGGGPRLDVLKLQRVSGLSGDFLQVAERAAEIAGDEERRARRWTVGLTLVVAAITVVGTIFAFVVPTREDVREVRDQLNTAHDLQIQDLEERLKTLERQRQR
jgi:dCTP deaminase